MDRAERKRQGRENAKKTKTYNLTKEQLDKMLLEAEIHGIGKGLKIATAISTVAINRTFKIGKMRMRRWHDEVVKQLSCVGDKDVTYKEVFEIARELGVDVESE